MGRPNHNEGLIQSGGNINVGGSLAIGSHAIAHSEIKELKASLQDRGLREIADKLETLVQAISQNAQALDNRDELHRYTREITAELSRKTPDKLKLSSILEGIGSGVKSIASITGIVEGLKALVASCF